MRRGFGECAGESSGAAGCTGIARAGGTSVLQPTHRIILAAIALLSLSTACTEQLEPTGRGGLALSIASSSAVQAVTTWNVSLSGPTSVAPRTGLLPGATVEFTGLQPGTYTITLEGFEGSRLLVKEVVTATVAAGPATSVPVNPAPVPIEVSVAASDGVASELGDGGAFTLSRMHGSLSAPLTVSVALEGTATNGTDYQAIPTQLTIPTGQADLQVTVSPILDAVVEGAEVVTLRVVPAAGYTVGASANAGVTITDAPVVTITAPDPTASEVGPDAGSFQVVRTGPVTQPLTVAATIGGSATNGVDYQSITVPVVIPAGQASVLIPVTPLPDGAIEPTETVIITLAATAPATYAVGTPSSATVSIADTPLPSVTIIATDATASEVGPGTGTVRISRTGPTLGALNVIFAVSGSAVSGTDFVAITSPANIVAGATFTDVTITPILDALEEGDETVIVTILDAAAYDVGASVAATVSIADAPIVSVRATDASASEVGPDVGTFELSRTGPTTQPLTVSFAVSGSATNGVDYQTITSPVIIPAGQATTSITVTPIADAVNEPIEAVILTLVANPAAYAVGSANSATVNVADTPPPPSVTITATDAAATEVGAGTGTFRISRGSAGASALTVNVSISGSATNGVDYVTLPTSHVIPSGAASVDVVVTPRSDVFVEGDETVVMTVEPGTGYTVGTPSSATITILDAPVPVASSISITPASPIIVNVNGTVTLTATVRDQFGSAMPGVPITWAALDPSIATVSSTGVVTGVAVGTGARIRASTPGAGGGTLTATALVDVVDPCVRLIPHTIGSTYSGRFDASTCRNFLGFAQVDQFSVDSPGQESYLVRLTPTFAASLVPLNIGSGFFGLPPTTAVTTTIVVKRAGQFGLMVATPGGSPLVNPGTYSLTTTLNPDPRQLCVNTYVTRGVSFSSALTPSCVQRDVFILPALTNNVSIVITALSPSFPVTIQLREFNTNNVVASATAASANAPATINYTSNGFRFVYLRLIGPSAGNDNVAVTISP